MFELSKFRVNPLGNYLSAALKGVANGVAELGTDGKIPSAQLPSITPTDYGRYQAEFNLTGATLSNGVTITTDGFKMTTMPVQSTCNSADGASQGTKSVFNNSTVTISVSIPAAALQAAGIQYIKGISIPGGSCTVAYGASGSYTLNIKDGTTNATLYTTNTNFDQFSFTGYWSFNASSINKAIDNTHPLLIEIIGSSSNITMNYTAHTNTGLYANATIVGDGSGYVPAMNLTVNGGGVSSGTVIKTYTPSGLKAWGNFEFTKTNPTNGTITFDILDNSNNVLKTGITSKQDLSDINTTTYPIIKVRTNLSTTDVTTDKTYTIKDVSMTWKAPLSVPVRKYAPSDVTLLSANTERSAYGNTYTTQKVFRLLHGGKFRVTFDIKDAGGGTTTTAQIIDDFGNVLGTSSATTGTGSYVSKSVDTTLDIIPGSQLKIQIKSNGTYMAYIRNAVVKGTLTDDSSAVVTD